MSKYYLCFRFVTNNKMIENTSLFPNAVAARHFLGYYKGVFEFPSPNLKGKALFC